jgi:anti-anti-sigma regulatory factor
MVRITKTLKDSIVTIKVDGRLVSGGTEALVAACEDHRGPMVVDLSDLQFADDASVGVLRKLKAQGARIVGARPYVSLQLAERDDPITDSL